MIQRFTSTKESPNETVTDLIKSFRHWQFKKLDGAWFGKFILYSNIQIFWNVILENVVMLIFGLNRNLIQFLGILDYHS